MKKSFNKSEVFLLNHGAGRLPEPNPIQKTATNAMAESGISELRLDFASRYSLDRDAAMEDEKGKQAVVNACLLDGVEVSDPLQRHSLTQTIFKRSESI